MKQKSRSLQFACAACSILFVVHPAQAEQTDVITVKQEFGSCQSRSVDSATYYKKGANFECDKQIHLDFDREFKLPENFCSISTQDVTKIRESFLQSEIDSTVNLAEFGVTPQTFELHKDDMTKAISRKPLREIFQRFKFSLSYSDAEILAKNLLSSNPRANGSSVQLCLPGNPMIKASSYGSNPGMVPWTIAVGQKQWKTYSPKVPDGVVRFLPPNFHSSVKEDSTFWAKDFWTGSRWNAVARALISKNAEIIAREFPAYAQWKSTFEICGPAFLEPYEEPKFVIQGKGKPVIEKDYLDLLLSVLPQNHLIDQVSWTIPFVGGVPKANWNDLGQLYEKKEKEASRIKWLTQWKKQGSDRKIMITYVDKYMMEPASALWKKAGTPGLPQSILLMVEKGTITAAAVLSDQRLLIVKPNDSYYRVEAAPPSPYRETIRGFPELWRSANSDPGSQRFLIDVTSKDKYFHAKFNEMPAQLRSGSKKRVMIEACPNTK